MHPWLSHRGALCRYYPQALLETAKSLMADGQCSIAVDVTHMACEVAVERSLFSAFAAKGLAHLEDSVLDLLNGYTRAEYLADKSR